MFHVTLRAVRNGGPIFRTYRIKLKNAIIASAIAKRAMPGRNPQIVSIRKVAS